MNRVIILILAATLLYMVVSKPAPQEKFENAPVPVDQSVISLIIQAVQDKQPGWVPVDTVYVNQVMEENGGSLFNSRFMFYDKYKYSGSQIDVQASVVGNKAEIVSMTPVSSADPSSALAAYTAPKYQDYNEISGTVNKELDAYLAMSRRPSGFQAPF
jgi:hypothetical protein